MQVSREVMDAIDKARQEGRVEEQGVAQAAPEDAHEPMAGLKEYQFQEQVVELAQQHGWLVAHFRAVRVQRADGSVYHQTPVQADGAGFVDLLLVKPGHRTIFAELKSERGTLSAAQKVWRDRLLAANECWTLWRPRDWPQIRQILGRKP